MTAAGVPAFDQTMPNGRFNLHPGVGEIASVTLSRRRALLGLLLLPGATAVSAASPVRLVYAEGRLSWPGGEARAACGKGGVRADKREGDGASPQGTFPLLYGFFRPDRVEWPRSELPMTPLRTDFRLVRRPQGPQLQPPRLPALCRVARRDVAGRRALRHCGGDRLQHRSGCAWRRQRHLPPLRAAGLFADRGLRRSGARGFADGAGFAWAGCRITIRS